MFVARASNGSATVIVVEDTLVCVPLTVRLPAIVTSSGKPTVIVPAFSATVTSLAVPAKVNVPPRAIGDVFEPSLTVTLELAK